MPGAVTPTWVITLHAIRRYRERIARVSFERAIEEIAHHLDRAHFVKRVGDVEHWRGPKRGAGGAVRRIRFRAKRSGDKLELVTVLGAFDR